MATRAIGFAASFSPSSSLTRKPMVIVKVVNSRRTVACSAIQETATSAVATEAKERSLAETEAAAKPKPKPKAAEVPLHQLMEEEVIPALRSTLEAQKDITNIELSFHDNTLEGSFQQKGTPYSFWAFFPDGNLTGPKGFSISSFGAKASTVEPFIVDEKKPTSKHVVFWVEKRLAAQGILPVWTE
uniref:Uncharacterized protein n=1 Tax=Kalanchoe fedtschenkoi TaxID=63787 RepID=A0A7N0UHV9_KALFE